MEQDHSEIYEARLRAFRPWAWYLLAWLVALLAVPLAVMALDPGTGLIPWLVPALALLALPALPALRRVATCPACGRFMGRDIGIFCPLCGTRLRQKDKAGE